MQTAQKIKWFLMISSLHISIVYCFTVEWTLVLSYSFNQLNLIWQAFSDDFPIFFKWLSSVPILAELPGTYIQTKTPEAIFQPIESFHCQKLAIIMINILLSGDADCAKSLMGCNLFCQCNVLLLFLAAKPHTYSSWPWIHTIY